MQALMYSVDWQALATFSTGVLAVVAASWVAKGQLKILQNQTDIQHLTLQHNLYNTRAKLYTAIGPHIEALAEQSLPPPHVSGPYGEARNTMAIYFSKNSEAQMNTLNEMAIKVWEMIESKNRTPDEQEALENDIKTMVETKDTLLNTLINEMKIQKQPVLSG